MMLSLGALKKIHQGISEEDDRILQVLGHKEIQGSNPPRYRLHLSDGRYSTSRTILATNLNYLISDNKMEKYSIVKVSKMVCNRVDTLPSKLVIILLEVMVLTPGAKVNGRFGNPVQLEINDDFCPEPGNACKHCNQHNHPK